MGEDRCKASQLAYIRILLHAQHVDGFTQGTVQIAILAVGTLISSILAVINADGAVVAVVFMIVVSHPLIRTVVMLIYQIYWRIEHPQWVVGAPCLHIADDHDIRIFGMDGIIEPGIAATVLEACLRLTVLIAYFDEFKSVWFLVAVGDASSSPLCGFIAVGILNGIQGILH